MCIWCLLNLSCDPVGCVRDRNVFLGICSTQFIYNGIKKRNKKIINAYSYAIYTFFRVLLVRWSCVFNVLAHYFLCLSSNCLSFSPVSGKPLPNGTISATKSKFDDKIEASSAKMYFHYYGQLLHQQNMLQDYVRTGNFTRLWSVHRIILHYAHF